MRGFVAAELPQLTPIARSAFEAGMAAAQVAVRSGAASSMGEARRLIAQGGLYLEDNRVTDPNAPVAAPTDGRLFVRIGKRRYRVLPIEG